MMPSKAKLARTPHAFDVPPLPFDALVALFDMNRQTPAQARAAREWPSGTFHFLLSDWCDLE